ncbi:MAG: (d)CMP kinase [Gammaproteobacteria bacterium]|nr:(d)CMP kinase [Gammaproteobacteria bacterium]MCP5135859.1 (d)CMP kinase [Gammaproteobacteria bacterium]
MSVPILTIDGPSGAGKGTVATRIASIKGWHFLDSGALYRITAHAALRDGIALDNEAAVSALAATLPVSFDVDPGTGEVRVVLAGEDIGDAIRSEEAGNAASKVAAIPGVRAALLQRQRDFHRAPGLVADGRDMGTVVFPDADTKVFLTASAEERAKRRYKQLSDKGISANLRALADEIAERDARDSQRAVSPLKPADDALTIDSSDLEIDEVVRKVLSLMSATL